MITARSAPFMKLGKPERRPDLLNLTDNQIIGKYGAEWRGYLLAQDVWRLNRLQWVMLTSMLKTLAGKHRATVTKMARKHQAVIETPHGSRVCFQTSVERAGKPSLVARFGGIPLKRQKKAVLDDRRPAPVTGRRHGSELLARLRAGQCELCQQRAHVQVHQVPKLAQLTTPAAATAVGATDGQDAAKDADRLPTLPRQHPQPATCQHAHVAVTGEPVAGTTGTAGSDRGPLEKDPTGHLASGLPVRHRVSLGRSTDSSYTASSPTCRFTLRWRDLRAWDVADGRSRHPHRDRFVIGRCGSEQGYELRVALFQI